MDLTQLLTSLNSEIKEYTKVIKLNYKVGETYFRRGCAYFEKGKLLHDSNSLDLSIKDFTKAIKLNCHIGTSYFNRGSAYCEKGDLLKDLKSIDLGIKDYTKAIELNYNNAVTWTLRGLAYVTIGKWLKDPKSINLGIEDYTKAIELNYYNVENWNSRALAYVTIGEWLKDPKSIGIGIEDFTKAIELNYNNGEIWFNRGKANVTLGKMLKDTKRINLGIEDYTKAIQLNCDNGQTYLNRGEAYLEKGRLLKDAQSIDLGIEDYTKAIKLNYKTDLAYANRGLLYFHKGSIVNSIYFEPAIIDLSKAIELDAKSSCAYFNRGLVYNALNQLNNCLLDWHVYQYLDSIDSIELRPESIVIIQETKEEKYNLFSFFIGFLNKGIVTNRSLFDFIKVREKLKDYLFVFKYIGFNPSDLSIKNVRFQQALPILIYYLKGCVSSYRLYDEKLDDGERELSAQDYYYYVQSARQFSKDAESLIGTKAIMEDAINTLESRTNLPHIDKYYLGLLYLIRSIDENDNENESRNWRGKALDMFNQTNILIWSKRMVDILKNENASQSDFDNYVLNHCNEKKEIAIDALINPDISQDVFMEQFADYIHFHEVENAFYELRNIFDEDEQGEKTGQSLFANRVVYHDPLWEVFKLSNKSICELCENSLRITDEKIVEKIVENLIIIPLTQEEQQRIEKDFTQYTEITDGKKAEDLILRDMKEKLKQEEQEEIDLVLRYLFEKSVLEKKQYYSLSLYYHCFFNDIKSTKDSRLVLELLIPIVSVTSQTQYIVLLSGLMSAFIHRLLDDKIQDIKNDFIKYSKYEDFSNNLWRGADELWRKENGRYYCESDDLFDNLIV